MTKILFVDDDENLRILYEDEFISEGYNVLLASSGEEAIDILENNDVDIMVLDIKMSGINGLETLKKIIGNKRHLPVILNTAYPDFRDDFNTWMADAYIIKSSNLDELKNKIKELLL